MVFNIACGSPVIYDIFFHAHSISQNIKHSNHMFRKMTLSLVNHGKSQPEYIANIQYV